MTQNLFMTSPNLVRSNKAILNEYMKDFDLIGFSFFMPFLMTLTAQQLFEYPN